MSPDLGRFLQPDPIGFKGDASNLYRYCGNDWANRADPMGLYGGVDDLALLLGGAAGGIGGQLVHDAFAGHWSSWTDYAGSAAGGAVGAWVSEYGTPVAGGMAGAATANFVTQGLRCASGAQHGFNGRDLVKDTARGAALGMIPMKIPLKGLNAGRNSDHAIFEQMHTKLKDGTVKHVSTSTAAKMTAGVAANEAGHAAVEGAMKGAEDRANAASTKVTMEFSYGVHYGLNIDGNITRTQYFNGVAQPTQIEPPKPQGGDMPLVDPEGDPFSHHQLFEQR